jgi:uncharacterized protein YlaI
MINDSLRRTPVVAYCCNECDAKVETDKKRLIDTQLCEKCLIEIEKQTAKNKTNKNIGNIAAEELDYNYTRYIGPKTYVCAKCESVYTIADKNFVPLSADEQNENYNNAKRFCTALGKEVKKFRKQPAYYFELAPKGWTNDILCKNCFDAEIDHVFDEAFELDQITTENRVAATDLKRRSDEADHRVMAASNAGMRFWLILIIAIVLVFLFDKCNTSNKSNDPNYGEYNRR